MERGVEENGKGGGSDNSLRHSPDDREMGLSISSHEKLKVGNNSSPFSSHPAGSSLLCTSWKPDAFKHPLCIFHLPH